MKKSFCTLLSAACALAVASTPAGAASIKTHSISRAERLIVGPEHAAEHAGLRMLARMQARAWRRLSPAQRRRAIARERALQRKRARAAAAMDPAVYGKWTYGPFRLPVPAIHAALLPTGKVLFFAFPFRPETNPPTDASTTGDAWVWDPAIDPDPSPTADPASDPAFKHVEPPYDPETGGPASLFCAGLSILPNGDVFVTGGTLRFPNPNSPTHLGIKRAYTFNPWTETWIQQPDMRHGRWYPSNVELPDGRTAVLAGSNETNGANNYELEVFTPTEDPSGVGTWDHPASADRSTALYPHMILLGNGKVLLAGPNQNDTGLLDPSTMTWSSVPAQDGRRTYGTEMLEPNGTGPSMKVTEIGGFGAVGSASTFPALATSRVLDLSLAPPQWTAGPDLNVARANFQTLWLPDGSELNVGGGNGMQNGSTYVLQAGKPEHQIELTDPSTGGWMLGPPQQIDRAYHSTALLLPDGRVLSAGDDNPYVYGRPYEGAAHNSGEIYSPPYLFRGTRPKITSAPGETAYNSAFHVSVDDVDPTDAHAVLIPPGAVTHATNPSPRIVPLRSTPAPDGLDLVSPANANIAPPGWYMLFVVNSKGVPSVAAWVRVGYGDVVPPPPDADPPPGGGPVDQPPASQPRSTQPLSAVPAPKATRSVEWMTVASRQPFRKGYVTALLGLSSNQSLVSASLVLAPTGAAHSPLLGKQVLRGQHAGTVKLVVRPRSARLLKRLLAARQVWLRVTVSAPGAPAFSAVKRIANRR